MPSFLTSHEGVGWEKLNLAWKPALAANGSRKPELLEQKRAWLASATLVSSDQIGGRGPKESKCININLQQLVGLGEAENSVESCNGSKWGVET